jgi:hypothetical protein
MGLRAELTLLVRLGCSASEVLLTTSRYRSCGAVAGGAFAGCRRGVKLSLVMGRWKC